MYSRAFLRFWWVLALGLAAAVAAGGLVAKHHRPPTYSTSSQLLVDSAQHPFLRVAIGGVPSGSASASTKVTTPHSGGNAPDTQALVQAANFYPMLINSDVVKTYREKHFGIMPGTVKARAVDATQGQNRYVPSIFPVIEIDSTGPTAEDAIGLSTATATSFQRWLEERQTAEAIPAKQRISVVPIVMAKSAIAVKHTRYSLAIVAGFAAFAAFLGLAVVLDRFVPRRRAVEAPDDRLIEQRRVEVAHRPGI